MIPEPKFVSDVDLPQINFLPIRGIWIFPNHKCIRGIPVRGPQSVDADPYVVSLPDVEGVVQVRQYVIISPPSSQVHEPQKFFKYFSNRYILSQYQK